MSPEHPVEFTRALARLGYSSLTDLFIDHPTLHFWTVAPLLSDECFRFAPIHVERALRAECEHRDDFHFFVRFALFTALHSQDGVGWGSKHYMLAGVFGGILGEVADKQGQVCWDYLQSLDLPKGWTPSSIFDPILEASLTRGFPIYYASSESDRST